MEAQEKLPAAYETYTTALELLDLHHSSHGNGTRAATQDGDLASVSDGHGHVCAIPCLRETPCHALRREIYGRAVTVRLRDLDAPGELYVRQMIPGRDYCLEPPWWHLGTQRRAVSAIARGMRDVPAAYAVGSKTSRQCVLVNAAWDVRGILHAVKSDGMHPTALTVTSSRLEHVGGKPDRTMRALRASRLRTPGLASLAKRTFLRDVPIFVHGDDADRVQMIAGIAPERMRIVEDNTRATIGSSGIRMRFLHTPGTTPGALCVVIEQESADEVVPRRVLLSGDTLLLPPGSSSSIDYEQADAATHKRSVAKLQQNLPPDTIVLPGRIAASCPLLAAPLSLFLP